MFARSTHSGNAKASRRGTSKRVWFSRIFLYWLVREPLTLNIKHVIAYRYKKNTERDAKDKHLALYHAICN